jgi:ATP-dependent Clp protease ATP-binding subunit ClpC
MFERFTDRARKAMQLANQEAQRLNDPYVGTDHILLGLVKEAKGAGAHVLARHRIDLVKVREVIEAAVHSLSDARPLGKLPLTPRAKTALAFALDQVDGPYLPPGEA